MNGENGNGNGHGIFGLVAKTDPDTVAMFTARRNARADARLTTSMKACFDEIADRSFNPEFYDVKGIVTISDSVLAEIFSVSNRTVYTWKRRLEECGYAWCSKKLKSNMWPLTTYHLNCLHKPMRQSRTDADGTYGGGKFRHAPLNPGLGCRKPGQPSLPLPGSRTPPGEPENSDLLRISGETSNSLRVSPEANFGSEPKPISGETRSKLRARPEVNFGSEPKPISGESRSQLPARAEASFQHRKDKVEVQGSTKGGTPAPDALELEFKKWEVRLDDMRNSDLRKLDDLLKGQLVSARSETTRSLVKRKLVAVRLRITGPAVVEPVATATASTAKLSPPKGLKKISDQERDELAKKIGPALRLATAGGPR